MTDPMTGAQAVLVGLAELHEPHAVGRRRRVAPHDGDRADARLQPPRSLLGLHRGLHEQRLLGLGDAERVRHARHRVGVDREHAVAAAGEHARERARQHRLARRRPCPRRPSTADRRGAARAACRPATAPASGPGVATGLMRARRAPGRRSRRRRRASASRARAAPPRRGRALARCSRSTLRASSSASRDEAPRLVVDELRRVVGVHDAVVAVARRRSSSSRPPRSCRAR